MMIRNAFILTLTLFLIIPKGEVYANDACSRTATIGHQEVLIDGSSGQRGEGLRFFLEQDPIAISYLDEYQEQSRMRWQNAALGTAGTGLILAGAISNASSDTKQNLYVTGVSFILINFLVARTLEMTNERNLIRAIEEYNKRNLPRIYFGGHPTRDGQFMALNYSWNF